MDTLALRAVPDHPVPSRDDGDHGDDRITGIDGIHATGAAADTGGDGGFVDCRGVRHTWDEEDD